MDIPIQHHTPRVDSSPTSNLPTPIHLLDGGLGTTLSSPPYSGSFSSDSPLWSSSILIWSPSTLLAAQTAFIHAGADVILTATYQASYEGFFLGSKRDRVDAGVYMRNAVEIAQKAVQEGQGNTPDDHTKAGIESRTVKEKAKPRARVALSLGAYGACLRPSQEYTGDYDLPHSSVEGLREWHFDRIATFLPLTEEEDEADDRILEDETVSPIAPVVEIEVWLVGYRESCWVGIDLVAFETLPRVDEVVAVREVMGLVRRKEVDDSLGMDGGKTRWGRKIAAEEEVGKPFWISCVFPGEENRLPDGTSVKDVVRAMIGTEEGKTDRPRPMAIGLNCTRVSKIENLIKEFEDAVTTILGPRKDAAMENGDTYWPALVFYPDGTTGEVYNTVTKEWETSDAQQVSEGDSTTWDEKVFEIVQGVRERGMWKEIYVGGCCRTGPEDIRKLRGRIDGLG